MLVYKTLSMTFRFQEFLKMSYILQLANAILEKQTELRQQYEKNRTDVVATTTEPQNANSYVSYITM